ncbi:MAG TPA: cupin domain-containing protein [Candidatus Acidoferrales bacterium]|nr:cupin domain-containing protein [Candidatus Acidoferrales bacterium]
MDEVADIDGFIMITVKEIITMFGLTPHPEGGYYRETYRSVETIRDNVLPNRYKGDRTYGTAIYYLLTPDTFSALHHLKTDEVYHFYLMRCTTSILVTLSRCCSFCPAAQVE